MDLIRNKKQHFDPVDKDDSIANWKQQSTQLTCHIILKNSARSSHNVVPYGLAPHHAQILNASLREKLSTWSCVLTIVKWCNLMPTVKLHYKALLRKQRSRWWHTKHGKSLSHNNGQKRHPSHHIVLGIISCTRIQRMERLQFTTRLSDKWWRASILIDTLKPIRFIQRCKYTDTLQDCSMMPFLV